MTGPLAYEPVPRSLAELLDQTVVVMRRRAGLVAVVFVLPTITLDVLIATLGEPSDPEANWLALVVDMGMVVLPYIVLQGFPSYVVTWLLAEELSGRATTTQDAVGRVLRNAPRIAWTNLLFGALYFAGFAAFLLPMLWITLMYFVSDAVMCVEDRFGWAALHRSQTLMKGAKRRALPPLLLWFVLAMTVDAAVGSLVGDGPIRQALTSSAEALMSTYLVVFALLFYFDLRIRAEAFDIELLAQRVHTE
jgi:hypothetical protein